MSNTFIFPRSVNQYYYPYQLTTVYQPGIRIYDPAYDLWQDPLAWEKIERDTVIAHAMYTRQHLVAGRSWTIQPGGASREDRLLSSIVKDMVQEIPGFAQARFLASRAVFRGASFTRMYGVREPREYGGLPELPWWRVTDLVDIDKRRFRYINAAQRGDDGGAQVEMQLWSVDGIAWRTVDHPEFFIQHFYQRDEESLGYGRGLTNAIFEYWRAKAQILTNLLAWTDRYGQGLVTVKIDVAAQNKPLSQIVAEYIDAIDKTRSRHVLGFDKRDELEIKDGSGQGYEGLIRAITYLDNSITRIILGSLLPSGGGDGESGSFARAAIEENSTESLIQYDREILGESFSRDMIGLFLDLNQPQLAALGLAKAKRPRLVIVQERKTDPARALAAGLPLIREEAYERFGFTPPGPDDEVVMPTPQAQLPPAIPGTTEQELPTP